MNALQNFAFEDQLVRIVANDDEPWFVGADVCEVLSLKNSRQVLSSLDDDERDVRSMDTLGGPQEMIVVSEAGVYRLVFRSRKPQAERFKRWLAHEVLPQLRKTGAYAPNPQPEERSGLLKDAPLAARVDAVRLARTLFGRDRAKSLWQEMGLPIVPDANEWSGTGETARLIKQLLDQKCDGQTIRTLVLSAWEGNEADRLNLMGFGIRVDEDGDGLLIGHRAPGVRQALEWAGYQDGAWLMPLRRIPHARSGPRLTLGGIQTRTTWLPLSVLDDFAGLPQ